MLNRVGIVAFIASLTFAGGVFLGRENPSDSGAARWFEDQPGVEQAFKELGESTDELSQFFASPTSSPRP